MSEEASKIQELAEQFKAVITKPFESSLDTTNIDTIKETYMTAFYEAMDLNQARARVINNLVEKFNQYFHANEESDSDEEEAKEATLPPLINIDEESNSDEDKPQTIDVNKLPGELGDVFRQAFNVPRRMKIRCERITQAVAKIREELDLWIETSVHDLEDLIETLDK